MFRYIPPDMFLWMGYTNHRFYEPINELIVLPENSNQFCLIVESILYSRYSSRFGKMVFDIYIYIYFSFSLARKRFINVCPWDGNIRLSSSRRKLCINGSVAGAPHTRPDRWITRNDDPSEERCFCQGLRPSFFFSSSFPIERVLRSIKPTSRQDISH